MNNRLKQLLILSTCFIVTACSTTNYEQQTVSEKKVKISTVYLNQLAENMSYELAESEVASDSEFLVVLQTTNIMGANVILKNALDHSLEDNVFGTDIAVVTPSAENPVSGLTPVLTPKVVMSADYSEINIELITSSAGSQKHHQKVYSSKQGLLPYGKVNNRRYWIDNSIVLRERIVDGLYDVSKQFAADLNAAHAK